MKLLDQAYQQEHHQDKTLSLKALQHPQVILRHVGYPPFPCLRIPYTIGRESSQDQCNSPERGCMQQLGSTQAAGAQLPEQDTQTAELCRPSAGQRGKWNRTGEGPARRWLCRSRTRRDNLSARADIQQSGRMPAREPGERKLSDEEPGKAPRLSSTVGRTKMEMANAKMSGISFLQRNNLY